METWVTLWGLSMVCCFGLGALFQTWMYERSIRLEIEIEKARRAAGGRADAPTHPRPPPRTEDPMSFGDEDEGDPPTVNYP